MRSEASTERERQRLRKRNQDPAYRAANNARNRNHPSKSAWDKIRIRIQHGTLKRAPCVFCGKPDGHAHHEDYSKPFDVVWVCQKHHSAIHRGELTVKPEHIVTLQVKLYRPHKPYARKPGPPIKEIQP